MFKSLDKNLNKLYKFSGYIAAIFLIFVAVFILIGISSRIFGFYIRGGRNPLDPGDLQYHMERCFKLGLRPVAYFDSLKEHLSPSQFSSISVSAERAAQYQVEELKKKSLWASRSLQQQDKESKVQLPWQIYCVVQAFIIQI